MLKRYTSAVNNSKNVEYGLFSTINVQNFISMLCIIYLKITKSLRLGGLILWQKEKDMHRLV